MRIHIQALRGAASALRPYGAQDSACPIDSRAALSDAVAVAWYAVGCPPRPHSHADIATRCASLAHGAWSAWHMFHRGTWTD